MNFVDLVNFIDLGNLVNFVDFDGLIEWNYLLNLFGRFGRVC